MTEEIDRNQPANKGDILDLVERIDNLKTELLSAFYGYTENVQLRLQERDQLRGRMANVEDRLLAVEKKLNLQKP